MVSRNRVARTLAALTGLAAVLVSSAAQAQGLRLIRDTEIEETIREESAPVLRASGLNPDAVHFYLVADKDLNAFVAAGQNIFLHTGLIQETENPNQLLGVIAHEAGHISGGHSVRQGDMQRAGMVPFILTMGMGLAAAIAGQGQLGAALMSSSSYFGTLSVLSYSRVQEAAADQAAVSAMEQAGLSSRGLVEFFDAFRYQEIFSEQKKYQFFRSHPLSSERIEALRRRAEEQSHYGVVDTAAAIEEHEIIKAKLDAFMNPPQQTFIKYQDRDTRYVARYARAIAYYQSGEADKALAAIDKLIAEHPDNPYLWELKGQVLFENARTAEAAVAHARSVELKPEAPLLRVNYAQSLIALNDPQRMDEAIAQLKRALTEENDNSFAWTLMAQAYESKQMPGQARLATAEARFALGDLTGARAFAMRAREYLTKDTPDWRRATDIVLVSEPTPEDLRSLARETRGG
ncbi:MAG: M48 family metalloprotease [Caulobacteraceae bacterium]|nr:M48 family metalloprotease [Caulobacteraceae bacterium]